MSLLDAIKKKKSHLKPNETRVTTVMGQIFREQTSSSGDRIQVELHETSPGYVVDETPDIQVAFVLPWLCFGSQDVVCDVELLNQNQISRVLSLGVSPPIHFPHIDYKFLPVYDEPGYNLSKHFPDCFTYIDHCHNDQSTVYVHCNAGISRSATIVIAYIMKHMGLDLAQAHDLVKKVRPCIKPNPGFLRQLKEWEQKHLKDSQL